MKGNKKNPKKLLFVAKTASYVINWMVYNMTDGIHSSCLKNCSGSLYQSKYTCT